MAAVVFTCDECVICLADNACPTITFLPCRHRCCCTACGVLIVTAKQPCPLCRCVIQEFLQYQDVEAAGNVEVPVEEEEIRVFKDERREDYIKRLRTPVTGDAAFRGKSKLARSVASHVGSELEERQRETAGTERVMTKRSTIEFHIQGQDLVVNYKLGRAKRREQHPFLTKEEATEALVESLGGDRLSVLEIATHYPDFYWNIRYHLGVDASMEDYFGQELGILQQKRK